MSLTNLYTNLLTNLILKVQITKILDWLIQVFTTHGKTLHQCIYTSISAPTWNDEFDLPDGSYSISDIQDYFEFIIKKHETLTENPPIQIYPNKIKNRIVFKIKAGYKLELLASEMMVLLGSAKKDVDKDKDGEDVPKLEPAEVVLIHCNLVNISYQQVSKVLFTFVPNKKFCQLITISPH